MASQNIKGISVQISGDTTQLGKAVKDAEDKSKALSSQLKDVNKLLKEPNANAVELLAQKQAILTDQVAATKEKLDTLRAAEESVQQQFEKGEITAEQMRAFQLEIAYTESAMRKYESAIETTNKKLDEARVKQGEESTSLGTLQAKISAQEQELSGLREQYKNTVIAEGENSASAKALANQISTLSGELNDNKKKLEDADKAADTFDQTVDDTAEDSGKAAKKVDTLKDSAKDAGDKFSTASVAVGTFMGNLALDVLEAAANKLVDIGKGALDTGMKFEAAISQLAATQGYSLDDLQGDEGVMYTMDLLTEKARQMGAATSFSAAEAADGLNTLAMSGYNAQESVGMIENVLHGAESGSMTIAEAASYVSGSMKGFKDQTAAFADATEASAYYVDLMAKGATLAATSVPELGQALSGSAATANTYKQSADSVTIALLRLAEQGEVGSGAATALNAAMKNLYAPTDTAKKALDQLGVSAYDESGNIRDFNEVVDELAGALNSLDTDEERNALEDAIFGQQGQKAFDKMIVTSGDKLQSFYDGIADASGSAALQSETMMDSLEGDLKKLDSAWSDLEISIYNGANEPIRKVVQTVTDEMIPAINALLQGTEGAEQQVGEAIGSLMSKVLTEITEMLPKAAAVLQSLASVLIANLPAILSGLGEMVAVLVADIVALLPDAFIAIADILNELIPTLIGIVADNLPQLIPVIMGAIEALTPVLTNLITDSIPQLISMIVVLLRNGVPQILQGALTLLSAIVDAMLALIPELVEALPEIITAILDVLGKSGEMIMEAALALLYAVIDAIPLIIPAISEALPQIVTALVSGLLSNTEKLLQASLELLKGIIQAVSLLIDLLIPQAVNIVQAVIQALSDNIPALMEGANTLFFTLVDILAMVIVEAVKLVPSLIQGIIEGLIAGIALVVQAVWNLGTAIIEGFKELFGIHSPSAVMQELAEFLVDGVVNGIKNLPSSMWDILLKAYNKVKTWGADLVAKGKECAKNLFDGIVDTVRSLPDKMAETGKNLVQGLWNGINNAKDWVLSKISGFCSSILDGITGFFDIHSPFRKTEYVGEMLDEGLAGGVEDNADRPISAIRRMASGLMDETAVIPERLENVQSAAVFPETLPIGNDLTDRLDRILQAIQKGQVLLLDGTAIVGGTIDQINAQLGQKQLLAARSEF